MSEPQFAGRFETMLAALRAYGVGDDEADALVAAAVEARQQVIRLPVAQSVLHVPSTLDQLHAALFGRPGAPVAVVIRRRVASGPVEAWEVPLCAPKGRP